MSRLLSRLPIPHLFMSGSVLLFVLAATVGFAAG